MLNVVLNFMCGVWVLCHAHTFCFSLNLLLHPILGLVLGIMANLMILYWAFSESHTKSYVYSCAGHFQDLTRNMN